MTIGLIFECGPQGADKQVCEYLAKAIRPGVALTSKTLDNKENLMRDAGRVAAQMLKDGCHCVLVIWDLRPTWPDKKTKPCRAAERQQILDCIAHAGLPQSAPVYLVCIEQELESWLIASDHAITAYLSTPAHAYPAKQYKKPDREMQPKALMNNHFKDARGWVYEDHADAIRVLKAASLDYRRLRRSPTFQRFEAKLLGCIEN
jgi:hypothetical protein